MRKGLLGLLTGTGLGIAVATNVQASDFQAPYGASAFVNDNIEVTKNPKQDTISEAVAAYLHQHGMCVSNQILYGKKGDYGLVGSTLYLNGIYNDKRVMPGRYEINSSDLYAVMQGEQLSHHWKVLVFDKNGIEKIKDVSITFGGGGCLPTSFYYQDDIKAEKMAVEEQILKKLLTLGKWCFENE
ncbi:MAG TPA: hypothetical protein VJJ23_04745 [Candidatus Nanoarchaeia archaeon]|nr:hypothetical protein [Candidatus Nanoarchaeia archaeon]